MGAMGLAKELAGELRQAFREVTHPKPRQPDRAGPSLPRDGDTRVRSGVTETWWRGRYWREHIAEQPERQAPPERMMPGPAWTPEQQQKAMRQARARAARTAR